MTSATDTATVLTNAAFGDDPGHWPLPGARTPTQKWLRAVAAGGQGRYGCAMTELAGIERTQRAGSLMSLAHSTRASFLRQLGWHASARGLDGRALALAEIDTGATADALIGLAADALGIGRFDLAARLLDRARAAVGDGDGRPAVRLAWVSAELAMARGDGIGAVGHAEQGLVAAARYGSARHGVKSEVVLAAALCSAGQLDRARDVADAALVATEKFGLVPLRWALACLLADIGGTGHTAAQASAIRDASADTVRRRGGAWFGR